MSNPTFAVVCSISLAAAFCASAAPVSEDEAATAVEHWLKSGQNMGCTGMGDVAGVQSYDGKESVGKFYVISLKNGAGEAAGYVVTSADRKLNPILAFSDDGTFEATEKNPLWVMLTIDVSAITKELDATEAAQASASSGKRLRAAALTENERKWAELLDGALSGGSKPRLSASARSSISNVRVSPLLATKWGQDYDRYYNSTWNLMTPSNYVCGCVATASAQIMKYWAWPDASVNITAKTDYTGKVVVGIVTNTWRLSDFTTGGTYKPAFGGTYQWSEMADEYNYSSSDESRLAVAKLVRDIGMSVNMTYKFDGSGSYYSVFHHRLTDQFGYKNSALKIKPSIDEIKKGVLCSLDLKSPCGVAVPGHAIVADGYGYDDNGALYVHFNLGWTGTDNAWYNPPDLTSADPDFTSIDTIIYNIYPPGVCSNSGRTIVSGRLLSDSGLPVVATTVTALNETTKATYTATTDSNGIYALLVPAASYAVSAAKDNCEAYTNLTVNACSSAQMKFNADGTYTGSSSSAGTVADIHGVDLTLVQMEQAAVPTATSTPGYRMTLVYLASTVPGAVIRYTTDGSGPTESSKVYTVGTAINVTNKTGATTIKARVYANHYCPSDVFSCDYYVKQFFGPTNGTNAAVFEDTPQNRADHWIFENEDYKEATGFWSNAVEYVDHKVTFEDENEFIVDNPSAGRNVTVEATVNFSCESEFEEDIDDIKAAVRIGTNSCFQVYTTNAGGKAWLDVDGVAANTDTVYMVRFELDMTNKTYSVSVKQNEEYRQLTAGGESRFPFANAEAGPSVLQAVCFNGEGFVETIYGSYTNKVSEFVYKDVVTVSNGTATLTLDQADWLNARGDYDAVAAVIKTLTSDQFTRAYLLNENIMDADYSVDGWGSFKITDIAVGDDDITVKVELVRNFAVKDGGKAAPINGELCICGYTELGSMQPTVMRVKGINFSDGDTEEHSFKRGANDRFFRAVIAEPENNL